MQVSIKQNIVANYLSQFYVIGIGIVMAPVYISFMGTEAYGLVGFFTMMTAWFQLLDFGLSPTLVRETARFRGGAIDAAALRAFIRVLEIVFGSVSLLGMAVLLLLSNQIAIHWLRVAHLSIQQVSISIGLMSTAVPLRWMSGLYRGVVNGFERQVWLGGFNVLIATARFIGVLSVFLTFGVLPVPFFTYQLIIAACELSGLACLSYWLVPPGPGGRSPITWTPLLRNMRFSLAIAFTATVWVVATQVDKLLLSKWLPLASYGIFSIAVVSASAVNSLGTPFGQALLPRMTKLIAEADEEGVARLYRAATQAVCVVVAPAATALTFFAGPILRAWTGHAELAQQAAPILCLYAIGNGAVALNSFAYYMQYAKGDLRLHFIGNAVLVLTLIPAVAWAGAHYGAIGTGAVWACTNWFYTIVWIPVVHARVFVGRHWSWFMNDVVRIAAPTIFSGWLILQTFPIPDGRLNAAIALVSVGILLFLVAAASSDVARYQVRSRLSYSK